MKHSASCFIQNIELFFGKTADVLSFIWLMLLLLQSRWKAVSVQLTTELERYSLVSAMESVPGRPGRYKCMSEADLNLVLC